MGGLHGGLIAGRDIETAGGSFTVRGLSAEAIFGLVARHREDLAALFERVTAAALPNGGFAGEQMEEAVRWLLVEAPALLGELIAVAAGPLDDEMIAIGRALPFPVQLAAIDAIADLTFTSEMPPKKVVETVVRLLAGTRANLPPALQGQQA